MGREKPEYRDNLEDILEFSGGKRLLTVAEVSRYTGKDRRWVEKFLMPGMTETGISAPTLARKLCSP